MHNAMMAACRRTAGLTAGLLLGAGLAGGVLLTPGTALADTAVATTTAITGTTQSPGHHGTALDVRVSVTPASGTVWPSGTVKVSDGSGGCQLTLVQDGSKAVSVGDCTIGGLSPGTYALTASYAGSSSFGSSASSPDPVTIGTAPVFYADSPSLTAVSGQRYSYTFGAKGVPAPGYALGAGSPGWLHIDSRSGTVWGTAPFRVTSFGYSVTASNAVGSATAGPYRVHVTRHHAAIATTLSCTSKVYAGKQGSCTLSVTNAGRFSAPDVTAQVSLPAQLRAVLRSVPGAPGLHDQRQHRVGEPRHAAPGADQDAVRGLHRQVRPRPVGLAPQARDQGEGHRLRRLGRGFRGPGRPELFGRLRHHRPAGLVVGLLKPSKAF
jgi:hypothetical protein